MEAIEFPELVEIVRQATYHSKAANGKLSSTLHVEIPINGGYTKFIKLERSIYVHDARDTLMEEIASADVLARELKYILNADKYEEDVYQDDEDEGSVHIGKSIVYIFKRNIVSPSIKTKDGVKYLCCVGDLHP